MADKSISQEAVEQLAILGTEESGTLSPLLKTPHSKNITLSDWNEFLHISDRNLADVRRVYDVLKKTLPELENYTTEQVAAILTTIQTINNTLNNHRDGLTNLYNTFSEEMSSASGRITANSVAVDEFKKDASNKHDALNTRINTVISAVSQLGNADVAKISVESTGKFGVYTLRITFKDSRSVSAEFDLPLEAVQIASVNDYVSDDGKRYLEIRFADENITPLNIELDEIFNIDVLKKQFIEKLESEYDEQVYLQDANGNVSLKEVSWVGSKPRAIVRRNSSGDIIIGPNTYSVDGAVSKGQMEDYVDSLLPYDVATNALSHKWAKVEIPNDNGKPLIMRAIYSYVRDGLDCEDIHTIIIDRTRCRVVTTNKESAPKTYSFASKQEYLWFPNISDSGYGFRVYFKGLNRKISQISWSEASTPSTNNVHITNVLASEVSSAPIASRIVKRTAASEVLMPELASYSSNAAVPLSYIESNFASGTEMSKIDEKISLLEGALVEYVEDSGEAYVKKVPDGVSKKAVLQRVQAMRWAPGPNLFDPYGYGYPVDDNGYIHFEADMGEGGYTDFWGNTIYLDAGVYYLKWEVELSEGDIVVPDNIYVDYGDYFEEAPGLMRIEVSEYGELRVVPCVDGMGMHRLTVRYMLSKTPEADFIPFGQVKSILNSIRLVSPNELNYKTLVDSSYIVNDAIRVDTFSVELNVGALGFLGKYDTSKDEMDFTFSGKVKAYDADGQLLSDTPRADFVFQGDGGEYLSVEITPNGVYTAWATVQIPVAQIGRLDVAYIPDGGYVEISDLMLVKGTKKTPYVPFFEQKTLFTVPSAISDMANNSDTNCVIDFENKKVYMDGQSMDASSYLTDYEGFKLIDVVAGANLIFANSSSSDVPSTIVYVKPAGGA